MPFVTFCCRVICETKGTSHQLNQDESGAREQDVDETSHKVEIVHVKFSFKTKTELDKKDKDSLMSHISQKKTEKEGHV